MCVIGVICEKRDQLDNSIFIEKNNFYSEDSERSERFPLGRDINRKLKDMKLIVCLAYDASGRQIGHFGERSEP